MSNHAVVEWVQEAKTDYQSALDLARRRKNPVPKSVCWHCQQCAEKYLKAFLIQQGMDFPFRHDLVELTNLCLEREPNFRLLANDIATLNAFGSTIRYPGSVATRQDARDAVLAMKTTRRFIRLKLGLR